MKLDSPEVLSNFEAHRVHLRALAYRMTGSLADAEDVLQEAFVRWANQSTGVIEKPRAYLSTLVTRLCLDHLSSARVRRESYVGPWLPEPILDEQSVGVEAKAELASDITVALLLALERLSPLERAAFLLHDVFDCDYDEVARTIERSEQACRQLVARARQGVRERRPRYHPNDEQISQILGAFAQATLGNLEPLSQVLAEDAVFYSDGGGKVASATRPILGRERIVKFVQGVLRKFPLDGSQVITPARVNGLPGFVIHRGKQVIRTVAFDVEAGLVQNVYQVNNPEKLTHLAWPVPTPPASGVH
jgi:RNA polymerase sigma-70 factor (ECF subfamily)